MRPKQWNDWLFLFAILCFLGAPICNAIILLGIERPEYNELAKTYDPGTSRPGHFISAGFINILRMIATAVGLGTGILFALIGCIRIPRSAASTRKLRDATWIFFCVGLVACLGITLI
jgi:hypothetical protein